MAQTIIREFKFKLSNDEKVDKAERLSRAMQKQEAAKKHLAETTKDIKNEIARLEGEVDELAEVLRSGGEYREVECRRERDDQRGEMVLKRLDNGEIVESTPMTADERQQSLPLPSGEFPEEENTVDASELVVRENEEAPGEWLFVRLYEDKLTVIEDGFSSEASAQDARSRHIKDLIENGIEVTNLEEPEDE